MSMSPLVPPCPLPPAICSSVTMICRRHPPSRPVVPYDCSTSWCPSHIPTCRCVPILRLLPPAHPLTRVKGGDQGFRGVTQVHEVAESVSSPISSFPEIFINPRTHPSRLHSPNSFCRQQASRKSLTGLNSQCNGRMAYHRSLRFSAAFAASASHSKRA